MIERDKVTLFFLHCKKKSWFFLTRTFCVLLLQDRLDSSDLSIYVVFRCSTRQEYASISCLEILILQLSHFWNCEEKLSARHSFCIYISFMIFFQSHRSLPTACVCSVCNSHLTPSPTQIADRWTVERYRACQELCWRTWGRQWPSPCLRNACDRS